MNKLIKSQDNCVKIYTGRQLTVYNYYMKDIIQNIEYGGWHANTILENINHTCKEGRYFIFGPWDIDKKNKDTGWDKVLELEKNKIIIPIGDREDMIYFVPPEINIMKGK